jgi:hypothetical protein
MPPNQIIALIVKNAPHIGKNWIIVPSGGSGFSEIKIIKPY